MTAASVIYPAQQAGRLLNGNGAFSRPRLNKPKGLAARGSLAPTVRPCNVLFIGIISEWNLTHCHEELERIHTMSTKTILVTGATGQQGGAVARHLLKQPSFAVRALTRDSAKPAARALEQSGAEVIRGDLDDPAAVRRALEGVYGVFSVQNFMEAGFDGEIRQGKLIADAAKAAGAQHFVYSSVVSADRHRPIHRPGGHQADQRAQRPQTDRPG